MFFYFMNPLFADAGETIKIGNTVTNYYHIASSITVGNAIGNKFDVRKYLLYMHIIVKSSFTLTRNR